MCDPLSRRRQRRPIPPPIVWATPPSGPSGLVRPSLPPKSASGPVPQPTGRLALPNRVRSMDRRASARMRCATRRSCARQADPSESAGAPAHGLATEVNGHPGLPVRHHLAARARLTFAVACRAQTEGAAMGTARANRDPRATLVDRAGEARGERVRPARGMDTAACGAASRRGPARLPAWQPRRPDRYRLGRGGGYASEIAPIYPYTRKNIRASRPHDKQGTGQTTSGHAGATKTSIWHDRGEPLARLHRA